MKIGFTGTQKGMSEKQKLAVSSLLTNLKATEFHHGDCVGADEQAHDIASSKKVRIILHPPVDISKRAFCKCVEILPAKEYLVRDADIVDMTDILIATPKGEKEEIRSGTWATVRRARKCKKPCVVVFPNGSTKW